uniref:RRM domain-containing protein n=1 Tax=Scleropages formosus TaxID=113540 RepID=A0A8C9V4A5_SCLFO
MRCVHLSCRRRAYVSLTCEEHLKKALDLNGLNVLGRELRVEKAKKDVFRSGKRGETRFPRDQRTLFLREVPCSAKKEDLKEVFCQAVDIRIPKSLSDAPRGWVIAYLEFETEAVAEKVMAEKQGAEVKGCPVVLEWTGQKRALSQQTLVVKNLPSDVTKDTLKGTFEKAVAVRLPKIKGALRGCVFAFVDFGSSEDAKEAMERLNNTEINGSLIVIEMSSKARPGKENPGYLCVKGLSEKTTTKVLKEAFQGCISARVVMSKESSKRFGFVAFSNEKACRKAKRAMAHCEIDGSKVVLDYAMLTDKRGCRKTFGHKGEQGGDKELQQGEAVLFFYLESVVTFCRSQPVSFSQNTVGQSREVSEPVSVAGKDFKAQGKTRRKKAKLDS